MSAITILAHADHGAAGVSAAFDATNFSTLRLNATAAPDYGDQRWEAYVELETAPAAGGPWRSLATLAEHRVPLSSRLVVSNHDNFVRVRHRIFVPGAPEQVVSFPFGVTGEGKPDAAP